MAFTSGNDVNALQATDTGNVGAGAGNDRYIVSSALVSANQQITITDTEGSNIIQLVDGLSITASQVTSTAALLTLSNGAVITILGANTFSYLLGGDALTGVGGTTQTYAELVTNQLGIASVPTGSTASTGTANVVGSGGSSSSLTVAANTSGGVTVTGTDNADTITATTVAAASTVSGSNLAGNDNITGGNGNDSIDGAAGNDTLDGGAGSDSVFGGAGNDVITGTGDDAQLDGDAGVDTLVIADGQVDIQNVDLNNVADQNITLNSGGIKIGPVVQQFENVDGSAVSLDLAVALDANDAGTAIGGSGDDTLTGGNEADTLTGNAGNDNLVGGVGNDTLSGGAGNDNVTGDAGNDKADGGAGNDTVAGGDGNDDLEGGTGNDLVSGDSGNDTLDDTGGNDTLNGGAGNDTLGGDRTLTGTNVLNGDSGNDTIYFGTGTDAATGGTGNDTFVLDEKYNGAVDTVNGNTGQDVARLEITAGAGTNTFSFSPTASFQGVGTLKMVDSSGNTNPKTYVVKLTDALLNANSTGAANGFLIDATGLPSGSNVQIDTTGITTARTAGEINVAVSPTTQLTDQGNNQLTDASTVQGSTIFDVDATGTLPADFVSPLSGVDGATAGGNTFSLTTTATEVITSTSDSLNQGRLLTSSDDTITAAAGTLQNGDTLTDSNGADNDTLTATILGAAGVDAAVALTNIENVNITANAIASSVDIDLSLSSGTDTIQLTANGDNNNATDINLTGLSGAERLSLLNISEGTVVGYTVGATPTALNITAQNAQLGVAGVNDLDLPATGLTTLNITSNGTIENVLDVATATVASAINTLSVTGAAPLDFEATGAVLNSIINNGGTSRLTDSLTGNLTFSVIDNTAAFDLTNVQSVDGFDLEVGATAYTIADVANNFTIQADADLNANLLTADPNTDTAADTLNVVFAAGATNTPITATNFETLNITANGAATSLGTVLMDNDGGETQTINILGNQQVTTNALGGTALDAINASGMTAGGLTMAVAPTGSNMTITGSGFVDTLIGSGNADTIIGGAGNDIINDGAGIDLLTGGSGNDTFAFTNASTGTPSASAFDTITDYVSGADKIDFGATNIVQSADTTGALAATFANVASGVVSFNAADDTLAERIVAVEDAISDLNNDGATGDQAAGDALIFGFGTDSYLFISDATAGVTATDVLIKLTGITGTGADSFVTTAGDITALV